MIGVFGASGFIGRHLTAGLSRRGHDILAVARSFGAPAEARPGVRRVEADFRDHEAMVAALRGVDTVIQLVCSSTPAMANARTTEDIEDNVLPHVRFLQECVASGVSRYVFFSSGGTVYGPRSDSQRIPETASTNPICSHGLTKLMVEKLIGMHGFIDQLDHVILRVSNPFGPGQVVKNGQGLIPALLGRYESGDPIQVFGDGSASRDYIYIDDLVSAVDAAITLPDHQQLTVNIGTGVARSIIDVVRAIEEAGNLEFEIEYLPARQSDVHSVSLDITRAESMLGWAPHTTFSAGIEKTLEARGHRPLMSRAYPSRLRG